MKKRDLEKEMRSFGWEMKRHGGKHDYWTNGLEEIAVPRHKEISERLAKGILKKVRARRREH
jgi:mRNA interferase HicA